MGEFVGDNPVDATSVRRALAALPRFTGAVAPRSAAAQALGAGADHGAADRAAIVGTARRAGLPLGEPALDRRLHATGVGFVAAGRGGARAALVLFVLPVGWPELAVEDRVLVDLAFDWEGLPIRVAPLPVQRILPGARAFPAAPAVAPPTPAGVPGNRQRQRPLVGGLSIGPHGTTHLGTLGAFVRRRRAGREFLYALSNNHVLADTDRLPLGTPIAQPGAEAGPTAADDCFARLAATIPIAFPAPGAAPATNRFDAALARVDDPADVAPAHLWDGTPYDPSRLRPPVPGLRVIKVGRTTGITHGRIAAVAVAGLRVDYGLAGQPRVATFGGAIQIAGAGGQPFSAPGDSGAIVVEAATGHPVGLLFAGDGVDSFACDLGALCRRLRVRPI